MSNQETNQAATDGLIAKLRGLYELHHHMLKYLVIGGMASAIDLIFFFVLYNMVGTSEFVAHSVSVPTAVVFSFVVNARHNFKTNDHAVKRFISFCIVCTIGYLAGFAVIVSVQQLFANEAVGANIGKIVSLPLVFIIQYILNSKITFRKTKDLTALARQPGTDLPGKQ